MNVKTLQIRLGFRTKWAGLRALTSTWFLSPSTKTTMLYTSFVSWECAPLIFLLPTSSFLQGKKLLFVRQNTSDPVSTRKSMGPILLPSSPSTLPLMLRNFPTVFSSSKTRQRPTATVHSFLIFSPKTAHTLTVKTTLEVKWFVLPAVCSACTPKISWVAMCTAGTLQPRFDRCEYIAMWWAVGYILGWHSFTTSWTTH